MWSCYSKAGPFRQFIQGSTFNWVNWGCQVVQRDFFPLCFLLAFFLSLRLLCLFLSSSDEDESELDSEVSDGEKGETALRLGCLPDALWREVLGVTNSLCGSGIGIGCGAGCGVGGGWKYGFAEYGSGRRGSWVRLSKLRLRMFSRRLQPSIISMSFGFKASKLCSAMTRWRSRFSTGRPFTTSSVKFVLFSSSVNSGKSMMLLMPRSLMSLGSSIGFFIDSTLTSSLPGAGRVAHSSHIPHSSSSSLNGGVSM